MTNSKQQSTDQQERTFSWAELDDEKLLAWRICDLGLCIEGTDIERSVTTLYEELDSQHIVFHPTCYLADEWFCPDGVPIIGIPFFLVHPRLKQLEQKMILEVEGGTREECLRLLRHEAGHAVNYAYAFHRRKRWRELFGPFSKEYKDVYWPRPYSRRYVRHLDEWYAQYHPDEDFAETFAVWLTPASNWREVYRGWKAMEKLEYVDQLMREIADRQPKITGGKKYCDASKLTSTLATFYKRKRRIYAPDLPDFYDRDLQRIFPPLAQGARGEAATSFIRRHRKTLLASVSRWTAEPKFMINRLLTGLADRCRELNLRVPDAADSISLDVASYLTTLTMNYRLTGKFVRKSS